MASAGNKGVDTEERRYVMKERPDIRNTIRNLVFCVSGIIDAEESKRNNEVYRALELIAILAGEVEQEVTMYQARERYVAAVESGKKGGV